MLRSLIFLPLTRHSVDDGIFARVEVPHANSNDQDRYYHDYRGESDEGKRYVEVRIVIWRQIKWLFMLHRVCIEEMLISFCNNLDRYSIVLLMFARSGYQY